MKFFTKLTKAIDRNQSLLCVGLDPVKAMLPTGPDLYSSLVDWGTDLINQTADHVCCFKPNIAFFEQFGSKGLRALVEINESVPSHIPVLLDAKRGDIGTSADAYALGAYQHFHADAITVSPYLGQDSVKAFLKDPDKAVFVLCQTSNPSAKEIQQHGSPPLFEYIAQIAQTWGTPEQIGYVIGATQPDALESVRQICPDHWFLAPGVGAQGGDLTQALNAGLRADGMGMIIPVSRSVIKADDPCQAAMALKDAINTFRQSFEPEPHLSSYDKLILNLFESGCVRFGSFTLASGRQSPIYIDLRRVVSFPDLFVKAVNAYIEALHTLKFNLVAGVPYAALPLGALAASKLGIPLVYPRKEAKKHGTGQTVEGAFQSGQRVVLIEDVITSGGSILSAAEALRAAGLVAEDAVVLVDRRQGGVADMAQHGITVHPILDIFKMMDVLKAHAFIDTDTYTAVTAYLQES